MRKELWERIDKYVDIDFTQFGLRYECWIDAQLAGWDFVWIDPNSNRLDDMGLLILNHSLKQKLNMKGPVAELFRALFYVVRDETVRRARKQFYSVIKPRK